MDVQSAEFRPDIRIKFASITQDGGYRRDANWEYTTFFDDLPKPWIVAEAPRIETRYEQQRLARVLKNDDEEIAAVDHETGLELLIIVPFGVSVAAKLTADTISGFVKWAWGKWRQTRQHFTERRFNGDRVEPSLVVEVKRAEGGDGRSETRAIMTFRGPLADVDIPTCLQQVANIVR
jgi:hypothetical protein